MNFHETNEQKEKRKFNFSKLLKNLFALFLIIVLVTPSVSVGAQMIIPIATVREYHLNPLYENESVAGDYGWLLYTNESSDTTPETYYSTIEEAAGAVREQMKSRTENITIGYTFTGDIDSSLLDSIMDVAFEHTGNPTEGDYLEFQYRSWGGSYSGYKTGDVSYLTVQYQVEYYTNSEQEMEMDNEVTAVIKQLGLDEKSEYQKICAIYNYICSTISYDYENLNDSTYFLKHTAYAALINKTAVCQGYAVLLYRMLLECGIDSRIIAGVSNGENHAWNIVKLAGQYYLLDSTWDAGNTTYDYFMKCEADFKDHTPEAEYTTSEFKMEYPIASENYTEESNDDNSGDFLYEVSGGIATITKYIGNDEHVVVPAIINGYPVKTLGQGTFYDNDKIVSVVIGEGISAVSVETFYSCDALESLSLPSTLKIGDGAGSVRGLGGFLIECLKLTTITVAEESPYHVVVDGVLYTKDMQTLILYPTGNSSEVFTIPEGVVTISDNAFAWCKQIKEVIMPDTVEYIGYWAFEHCDSLEKVNISKSCDVIGQFAFNKTAIKSLHIPASLTGIIMGLPGMYSLEEITVDENSTTFQMIDGALCTTENVMKLPSKSKQTSVVLPANITGTYWYAFEGCENLEKVDMSAGVESLNNNIFEGCVSLKEVKLSDKITVIPEYTFKDCNNLVDFVMPAGVTEIGRYAFAGCKSLKDIAIPKGVKKIEESSFSRCGFEKVNIPASVEKIVEYAFYGCENLTTVTIPESITEIPKSAFSQCKSLSSVTLPSTLTTIKEHAFSGCKSLQEVVFPKEIKKIEKYAFAGCTKMREFLLTSTDVVIEEDAFYTCNGVWIDGETKTVLPHVGTATCTEFAACRRCQQNEYKDFTNHSTTETVLLGIKEPTCTEEGYTGNISCAACHQCITAGEIIPATGHNWKEEYTVETEQTCTQAGKKYIQCGTCDAIKEGSIIETEPLGHIGEATSCTSRPVCESCGLYFGESAGHGSTIIVDKFEPTCVLNGYTGDVKCVVCENIIEYGTIIPPTGHIWNDFYTVDTEATCIESGQRSIHCSVCDVIDYAAESGMYIEYFDELNHSWDEGSITKNPTTTEPGEMIYICTLCSETRTEEIPCVEIPPIDNPPIETDKMLGDLDFDDKFTLSDAQVALKMALGIMDVDGTVQELADVNGDGNVTLLDAQLILQCALGIISSF